MDIRSKLNTEQPDGTVQIQLYKTTPTTIQRLLSCCMCSLSNMNLVIHTSHHVYNIATKSA